jgi:DNA-binding PadR family transcriptional regulator
MTLQFYRRVPHTSSTPLAQLKASILTLIWWRAYGTSVQKMVETFFNAASGDIPYKDHHERVEAAVLLLIQEGLVKVADYKPHSGDLTRKLYDLTEAGEERAKAIYGGEVVEREALTPEQIAAAAPKAPAKAKRTRKPAAKKAAKKAPRKPAAKRKKVAA